MVASLRLSAPGIELPSSRTPWREVFGLLEWSMDRSVRWLRDFGARCRCQWRLSGIAELGRRARLWGAPIVRNQGRIIVGQDVRLNSAVPIELVTAPRALLEIGDGTTIDEGCCLEANTVVRVGPRCHLGPHVVVREGVTLEEGVWLGARVVVRGKVTIGAGSVIGADTVVTEDIPPNSLVSGSPARVLCRI